jgi:hypothetical protein
VSSSLLVEFSGLPGAGKTTTAERVVESLRSMGYRCTLRPPLFDSERGRLLQRARMALFRLTQVRLTVAALRYALSVRPRRLSRIRYLRPLWFLAYYQLELDASADEIVILDQGIVQTLWATSVPGELGSRRSAERILDACYAAGARTRLFVHFRGDPATAAGRVASRQHGASRFDGRGAGDVADALSRAQPVLDALWELAVERTGGRPLLLEADAPLARNVERVVAFIDGAARFLEQAGAGRRAGTLGGTPGPAQGNP